MIDIFQRYPFLFHKLSRNSFTKITACLQFCSFFLWMELTAEERPLSASLMNHNIDEQTNTGHYENLLKQVLCRTGKGKEFSFLKLLLPCHWRQSFIFCVWIYLMSFYLKIYFKNTSCTLPGPLLPPLNLVYPTLTK